MKASKVRGKSRRQVAATSTLDALAAAKEVAAFS
jgi:hypothetical protein